MSKVVKSLEELNDQVDANTFQIGANTNFLATVESGTYTPTAALVLNLDSVVVGTLRYLRVGNIVTVFGYINIDATAVGDIEFTVPLPFASSLTESGDVGGSLISTINDSVGVSANMATNEFLFRGLASIVSIRTHTLNLTYVIK